MDDEVEFYRSPGPLTRLVGLDDALAGLPADPVEVATVVQGLILHPHFAVFYDVEVGPDRVDDVQVRPAQRMVELMLERDPRPLTEARDRADRFSGNCRHFTTLTVALLRRAGVPARARCGFGGYFEAGKWLDHWVVEHHDGERWVRLDAQIDADQAQLVVPGTDAADLAPGDFLAGGEAWAACRAGEQDGDRFGILDEWGQWFIVGNVARDLAALNKVEVLPWDGWGDLAGEGPPVGGDDHVDEIAALTMSGDHAAIRSRYESDPGLRVPSRLFAFATSQGPTWVDVPELA